MIPTKTDVNITGTLPGEDVEMTLDSNSLAHLMSVLSNLYSNKGLAIVREYSTNALDSHIEAGNDRPIEVSTPSDFMPFFKVRDYGVGMDAETIRNVYSRYGASTKRLTNTQNGMLGLGSKSALTYTTQFNITGIKDGIKTYVVVSRTTEGSGVMKIISQSPTDEHNGVEISIPISNKREIEQIAKNFFKFWNPATVLLNGKDPSGIEGMKFGRFTLSNSHDLNGQDYVVMGNVSYPIPREHRIFRDTYSGQSVIAYIDMGEVNFTPSREALHMTELTKKTLTQLRLEFNALVQKHLKEKVENASSHSDAIKSYFEMVNSNLGHYASGVTYRGKTIPKSFEFDWATTISTGHTFHANHVNAQSFFNVNNTVVVVYGYDREKVHSTHRAKVRLWLSDQSIDADCVYWAKDVSNNPWIEDITKVHWDDVNKMKLNRPKSVYVKTELFDTIDHRGYRVTNQKIDVNKSLVYASPAEIASQESKDMVARFLSSDSNLQLVLVNKNKWKSFKEDYPAAIHLEKKVVEGVSSYFKNLTSEEKIYLTSSWRDKMFCGKLDEGKILDPVIKSAIRTLTTKGLSSKTEQKYETMQQIARHWGIIFPNMAADGEKLFKAYPLLNVYSHSSYDLPLDHVYLYMNTCYEQNLVNH